MAICFAYLLLLLISFFRGSGNCILIQRTNTKYPPRYEKGILCKFIWWVLAVYALRWLTARRFNISVVPSANATTAINARTIYGICIGAGAAAEADAG